MEFRTSRGVLVMPGAMGLCALALSLATWPGAGVRVPGLTPAMGTAVSIGMLLLAGVFLSGARRLYHYRITADEKGLGVGGRVQTGLIPWAEVDALNRFTYPGGRGAIYEVRAGKRQVGFSSQLFAQHAALAAVIAEHTGRSWQELDFRNRQSKR